MFCLCRGANKRSALRSSNEWDFVTLVCLFRLPKKIGVSLEPWVLFVNMFVSEIEQKTIL